MAYIFAMRRYSCLLLLGLGLLFEGATSARAQTPPPTPTVDPLLVINTRLDEQKTRIEGLENQFVYKLPDILNWVGQTGLALFSIPIALFGAYKFGVNQAIKQTNVKLNALEQKFDERLTKTLYRLDPTAIAVWIEPELRKVSRLEELGFKNVKHFESVSLHGSDTKNMAGVIVCVAEKLEDVRYMYEQLKNRELLDGRIGVVFCSAKRIDDPEKVLLGALPYSFANAPATIPINVINVAHLVNLRLSQPQEGAQI